MSVIACLQQQTKSGPEIHRRIQPDVGMAIEGGADDEADLLGFFLRIRGLVWGGARIGCTDGGHSVDGE